jgi:hypothetical protein
LSAWLRRSLYSSFAALWLTGSAWLVLHYFFQISTDFGAAPHPWQPSLMTLHGVIAVAVIFLFGWVAGSESLREWAAVGHEIAGVVVLVPAIIHWLITLRSRGPREAHSLRRQAPSR